MKKKLFLVLLSVFLLTGCVKTPKLENGEEILASIDGKNYTAADLYENMKVNYGTSSLIDMVDNFILEKEITDNAAYESRAKSYIASMKGYYESSGYKWEDVLKSNNFTEESLKEYYINNYKKEDVAKNYYKSIVTDSEINKFYKDEIIGDITAKHILIMPESKDGMTDEEKKEANSKAYNKALEVISKLNNGEEFDKLVAEYSDDEGSKSNNGLLAPFNKQSSYVAEFIDEAVKLKASEYSKTPVKSTYGYHIIYVVSKADKPSLDSVKTTIIENVANKKIEENENYVYTAWKALREKYNLTINDTIVKEKYEQVMSQY